MCASFLALVIRLGSLLGLLALPPLTPLAAAAATVLSVGDGDTLRVDDGGEKVTIRVACIDAPEMAQSPHGQQAREALQALLPVGSTSLCQDRPDLRADPG